MTVRQVSAKIDIRLNKGASADYDHTWSYIKEEAFNKAVNEWVRRQKHGVNMLKEGDEETDFKVDDLQVLLKADDVSPRNKGIYSEITLPSDYLYFKRATPIASKGNCSGVRLRSYFREEANVDVLMHVPSFKFEETFHTAIGNKIHIYHNKDFNVDKVLLTYYRKPKFYSFKKLDTVIEFKDEIADIITDDACSIIASDIESLNARALTEGRGEKNT